MSSKGRVYRNSGGASFSPIVTAAIAGLVLVGWAFDIEFLKRILPAFVAMNPMTAVTFLLASFSLWLFSVKAHQSRISPGALGRVFALAVVVVGAARLSAVIPGLDVGVDQWLFPLKLAAGGAEPNRMAPNTAFNFLLIGSALLFLHAGRRRRNPWACIFALVCGCESLLAVLGYAYGIKSFTGLNSFVPMALHTAIVFLVLVYGIMSCQVNRGFLAIITGNNAGGTMARRLLPAVILVPAILGWLRLEGQRLGFYDPEFGVALYTVTNMVVFAWLVSSNALSLFRTDTKRTKAERHLRRAHVELEERVAVRTEELSVANASLENARDELENRVRERTAMLAEAVRANQLMMEHSLDVICTVDAEGRFSTMSAACEKLWGYKPEELLGQRYIDLVYSDDHTATNAIAARIMSGQPASDFENRYVHKNGSLIPIMWSAFWSETERSMFAVAHDNTYRKRTERALELARETADRANRAKSEFLSRMSHELRTPMNAILGFAQLLEMDQLGPGQSESVEQILKGGRHLLELINEVLDISSIEAGRLSISCEPVQLADLLQECVQLIGPLATPRRIRIEENFSAAGEQHVLADRHRLKQVMINLLSNAVKYNRDDGRVIISLEETPEGRLRINIADTGNGIAAKNLDRLFSPFERLDAEKTTIEGTGLGLALSKRLVEVIGGAIGVQSDPGNGSIFWVELPLAQSPIQVVAECAMPEITPPDEPADLQHTVLYIEDNLSNIRLIERVLLQRTGIELITAMQGKLGLDLAREHQPDMILLDLNLPDISGHEVLQRLRAEPATRATPVLVISADANPREIERMRAIGAEDYLTKPIDVQKFLTAVDRGLKNHTEVAAEVTMHPAI